MCGTLGNYMTSETVGALSGMNKLHLMSRFDVTDLCAANGVFTQVDTRRLAVLQTSCGHIRKQVLQALVLSVYFHS